MGGIFCCARMSEEAFIDIQLKLIVFDGYTEGRQQIGRTRSNHVILVRNSRDCEVVFVSNQRVREIIIQNCTNVKVYFLDSLVNVNRTCRLLDCSNCTFILEDVDIRRLECFNVTNSTVVQIRSEPVTENSQVYWMEGCSNNKMNLSELEHIERSNIISYYTMNESEVPPSENDQEYFTYFDSAMNHHHEVLTQQNTITPKGQHHLDLLRGFVPERDRVLHKKEEILQRITDIENTEFNLTDEQLAKAYDDERNEFYDSEEVLREKVKLLASALRQAKHTVIYTGAGISTSANIPDFRGPRGVWTMREKGESLFRSGQTKITPTLGHYAITELARRGLIKFVCSTNMDALHLRSGLPYHMIAEQHGNKHKERCEQCGTEYYRQYDTLETVTSMRGHHTGRQCTFCYGRLKDTIVHFSENLRTEDMNVSLYQARVSDLAVVLGTSMNVQPAASFPDKCFRNNGKLVIVNLQKTPYDSLADIRIFAKTDETLRLLMEELGYSFDTQCDRILEWDPKPEEDEESDSFLQTNALRFGLLGISSLSVLAFGYLFFKTLANRS